jgi:teichuronic acid biosynthesis glycosyltransferase TuaC
MDESIPLDKNKCREILGYSLYDKLILFAASFDNPVKNFNLAHRAVGKLKNIKLVELKGYTRREVTLLMNACDLLLVTSKHEGGPLVIKEALACGCPVVSTNVGDVKEVLEGMVGCYVTDFSADDISSKIQLILDSELDSESVARKVFEVYKKALDLY